MTSYAIFSDADILISAPDWAIIKELNSRVGSNASASGRYPPSSSAVMVIHPLVSKSKKNNARERYRTYNGAIFHSHVHAYNNPIYIYIQHTHIKSTIEGARRATFSRAIDARVRSEEFESFFRLFIQSTRGRAHAEDQSPSVVKITTPTPPRTTQLSSAQL